MKKTILAALAALLMLGSIVMANGAADQKSADGGPCPLCPSSACCTDAK